MRNDNHRTEMLSINERQAEYYHDTIDVIESTGSPAKRLWKRMKGLQSSVRKQAGIDENVYDLHWRWMGDLSQKRVMDLGCFDGSDLSLALAQRAKSYLGVDLSEHAIERLRKKLDEGGLNDAQVRAADFLSPEFTDGEFDVIYAKSVAHHFKYFGVFLETLAGKLAPGGGVVVTFDPMQTSLLTTSLRSLYRPFQPDRDWEWPFSKQTFRAIQQHFDIVEIQGVMGFAKWALPFAFINSDLATGLCKRLHQQDLKHCSSLNSSFYGCLQVAMCWKGRPPLA
ncbi:class I SAM-dependent methyltransferase [Gemmatimonadota bacterium]